VGEANRLAHAAAVRLAEDPAAREPLFLHGACGMGKTHLLMGLARRFQERHPRAVVRYLTAEAFTNEYIAAVRASTLDKFRRAFRRVDLLCIDDVHFVASKEATQAELLHTFDAIGLDGARVALASDEHPREIRKLNQKLLSRFLAGPVVRLEAPDPELRGKLIRALALRKGLVLEDAAVALLVERSTRAIGALDGFGGSVRELEGLVTQVFAVKELLPECAGPGGKAGVLLVRRALGLGTPEGSASPRKPRRPVPASVIVEVVCEGLNVPMSELTGKGRHKRVVLARAVITALCRRMTTLSFPEIARAISRPNHSTVITALSRLDRALAREDGGSPGTELPTEYAGLSLRELLEALCRRVEAAAV
jgi:chromosomal replication initiator protein